ncbi:MAG: hypothetical protein IKH57_13660 [Clostridia bacterium]|nr:hypothetical protein [Clostridia bacterium]
MYADLLLKQACIDAIEGDNTVALLALDAAIAVQPKLGGRLSRENADGR